MPKHVQVRNVPDDVHAALCARAAEAGLSLTEYLLRQLTRLARTPDTAEILERTARRVGARMTFEEAAALVREGRGEA